MALAQLLVLAWALVVVVLAWVVMAMVVLCSPLSWDLGTTGKSPLQRGTSSRQDNTSYRRKLRCCLGNAPAVQLCTSVLAMALVQVLVWAWVLVWALVLVLAWVSVGGWVMATHCKPIGP